MKSITSSLMLLVGVSFSQATLGAVIDVSEFDGGSQFDLITAGFYNSQIIFDQDLIVYDGLSSISDSGGAGLAVGSCTSSPGTDPFGPVVVHDCDIGGDPIFGNLSGTFSASVASFSVWVGDQAILGTDLDTVLLEVFNSAGDLIDTAGYTDSLGGQQLFVSGLDITSFQFTNSTTLPSGVGGGSSVGYDDFEFVYTQDSDGGGVISVPEPTSLALIGIGLAGLGFSRRKRK